MCMLVFCSLQMLAAKAFLPVEYVAVTASLDPTEAKLDRLMERYVNSLKAAFAEQDDAKTVSMINQAADELVPALEKLKPEIERWAETMTAQERTAYRLRADEKPYLKTMMELMLDPNLTKRLERSPAIQQALENAGKRTEALEIEGLGEDGSYGETEGR